MAGATAGFLGARRLTGVAGEPGQQPVATSQAASLAPLTLAESLRLAGQNLPGILNPEDHYLPYWALTVQPDYRAQLDVWWPAHNIGRWWGDPFGEYRGLQVEMEGHAMTWMSIE